MKKQQQGHVLLMLVIMVLLSGVGAASLLESRTYQQQLKLQQQARQTETLQQIRSSLLGFAASQGVHSQSHLGHLPCPAVQAGDAPRTVCLDRLWGKLPVHSKTAVNYLNAGIDPRSNLDNPASLKDWEYAVSSQLVQPNELNWGRWVDYSKPAIKIWIPEEANLSHEAIAAVVAKSIQPISEHEYNITPPYLLISVAELQAAMTHRQIQLIHETLESWKRMNPNAIQQLAGHENILALPSQAHTYQGTDSGCTCRCTRTRCNCSCSGAGKWRSIAPCWGADSHCQTLATYTRCSSDTTQACIFSGPARMDNAWPVSRFEPVAAANKSCRPTRPDECPLSRDSNDCTCDFSWPDATRHRLPGFIFHLPPMP
ncbi:MAG TPA: hypothetical protein VFV28_03365 [Limnobacter sp.]|nr:hypothetical protein [Limnobacter sp.]